MNERKNESVRLDQLCITTLRTLAIDAVEKAQSGHPGTPMGAAPTAYCLWQRFLRFDPEDPQWPNRDRFVLSAGHASALLYGLLYLSGVHPRETRPGERADGAPVTLAALQSFRQEGSPCTGHPEYGAAAGVEMTTGPLGQGVGSSVGMAIGEAWLRATYNRPEHVLFDHKVYALCGDGDMMEGVSAEAASLAGHLKLAHLCWIYDANEISIEGSTAVTFTEDVGRRFEGYGWEVVHLSDANDLGATTRALEEFAKPREKPLLLIVRSHIGYGAPHKQDTKEAHGEPLGAAEARLAKQFYDADPNAQFAVPEGVVGHFSAQFGQRGRNQHAAWTRQFEAYSLQYPDLATELQTMERRELPTDWDHGLPEFPPDKKGVATRDASGKVLNAIAQRVPWVLGGAADLSPSTKTRLLFEFAGEFGPPIEDPDPLEADVQSYRGRNFHFGVREHAMCAAASGMALTHLRPFASSFLIFSDYARGAIRLASMMGLPVVYIWTHDSISMGEDGPTHQPIEQLASLRAMPGMVLLRPADANEVVEAWRVLMQLKDRPGSLVLTRQALPTLDRAQLGSAKGLARGAYVLADAPGGAPEVLLLASGSEVSLCMAAYARLVEERIAVRVVSMPSWDLFEEQSAEYRESVLPRTVRARVSVEEAAPLGWDRYVGLDGAIIAMRSFGLSAPGPVVQTHFGFDVEHVVAAAREQLERHRGER
jgi:transketolase